MAFAHLTIATTDVEKTSRFFQRVMKWRALPMPENIDIDAAWLEIAKGQQLHVLGIADAEPAKDEEFGRHYAFFHPAADFEAVQKRLVAEGSPIIPPIRETPFRRFFFRDPNGYLFELIDQDGYRPE